MMIKLSDMSARTNALATDNGLLAGDMLHNDNITVPLSWRGSKVLRIISKQENGVMIPSTLLA